MDLPYQNIVAVASTTAVAAAGVLVAWQTYKGSTKSKQSSSTLQALTNLADLISSDDLGILANSSNSHMKRSAEQILLDRAARKSYLKFLYGKIMCDDLWDVRRAISVLGILCKHPNFRIKIVETDGIDWIAKCLWKMTGSKYPSFASQFEICQNTEKVFTVGIVALFDLIFDNDKRAEHFFACSRDFVSFILLEMIKDATKQVSLTAKRLALFIIYQLFQCSSLKQELLGLGIISHVSKCFLITLGDAWQSNICLQVLVICANKHPDYEVDFLNEMAQCGILPSVIGSMQSDDAEVVYWATGLVHEFCAKDLFKQAISRMPRIIRTLYDVLCRSEVWDQKIVLRILVFLACGNEVFSKALMSFTPMIKQLPAYLSSGHAGIVHWSLVLVHDAVTSDANMAAELLEKEPKVLLSLLRLDFSGDPNKEQLLAETIGLLCSCEMYIDLIIGSGAIKTILKYGNSQSLDLQFWVSEMLLNLAMASDNVKDHIIYSGGVRLLLDLSLSELDSPPISKQAAKTLVMLGLTDSKLSITLRSGSDCNIVVNRKEQSACSDGINFTTLNLSSFTFSKCKAYNLASKNCNIAELIHKLLESDNPEQVVFVVCQGLMNHLIPDDLKAVFSRIGFRDYDYPDNGTWALISMKNYSMFQFQVGEDSVVEQRLRLGSLVNLVVKHRLLVPWIDILTCIPATRSISRVSELDLIGILGRHDHHVKVMATVPGFVDHLTEMIWLFACMDPTDVVDFSIGRFVSTHSLPFAHCIGSLNILHALSMCPQTKGTLANSNLIACLVSALLSVTAVFLTAVCRRRTSTVSESAKSPMHAGMASASSCVDERQPKRRAATCSQISDDVRKRRTISEHQYSPRQESSSLASNLRASSGLDTWEDDDEVAELEDDLFDLLSTSTVSQSDCRQSRRPTSRSFSESSQRAKSPQKDIAAHFEDISGLISNIINYTIMTVYHLLNDNDEMDDELEATIRQSGLLQLVWCLLLTRNRSWNIGLTASKLLTEFSTDRQSSCFERPGAVHLVRMSPCSILSVDMLCVANGAWTFESVQASTPVSIVDSPDAVGWYYEVTVRTNGIMQIGWSNENCDYCNTKGIGIGDNSNSFGLDGARRKVWNGPPGKKDSEKDYGRTWYRDDVVSCLLTADGEGSFWLNGQDLGVAMSNIDMSHSWFPAASISLDQECDFNFGKVAFAFDRPPGFMSVHEAYVAACTALQTKPSANGIALPAATERTSSSLRGGSASSTSSLQGDGAASVPRPIRSNSLPTRHDAIKIRRARHSVVTPAEYYSDFQDDDASSAVMYYEVLADAVSSRSLEMGFQFNDGAGQMIVCQMSDMSMRLPSCASELGTGSHPGLKVKNVIGCGLIWPECQVFFTIDGVTVGRNVPFDGAANSAIVDFFPHISEDFLAVNFGEFEFQYHKRNARRSKTKTGRALYEGVLRLETTTD